MTVIEFLTVIILISCTIIIFKYIPYNEEKCIDSKNHIYILVSEKYVKGNDIGFGITNSYTETKYECKKCKKIYCVNK